MNDDLEGVVEAIGDVLGYRLVTVGDTPVTPTSILVFVLLLATFFTLARLLASGLVRWVLRHLDINQGVSYALARVVQYAVLGLGLLVAFQFLGIDLSSIAILLGALGVGIGLGLQALTANFVSGLILLFERPVQVGDRVTVADIEGDVVAVNMRATTVRSIRNVAVIVPNSEFTNSTVINWSHSDPRLELVVEVGVSYGSDLDTVVRCLREVAEAHPEVLDEPPPAVRLSGFGDSSWNMKLLAWIGDAKYHLRLQSELNMAIVRKFRENGVEIPFPQRDVHWRSPLPMPLVSESPQPPADAAP